MFFHDGGNSFRRQTFTAAAIIRVPGGLGSFDIGFVDADIPTYVLADRTNASVYVIDTKTNTFVKHLTAGFAGVRASPGQAFRGPDGVIIVDHREVWAGDAPSSCDAAGNCTHDSAIKAIDIQTGKFIDVMNTGGQRRADELCEDVGHEVVLMANDDLQDSFIILWSES